MKYTPIYNLQKPERTKPVGISDFNIIADPLDLEHTPAAGPAYARAPNGSGEISQWVL